MELQLDRKFANRRIYPAIDLFWHHLPAATTCCWIKKHWADFGIAQTSGDMNPQEAMEFCSTGCAARKATRSSLSVWTDSHMNNGHFVRVCI